MIERLDARRTQGGARFVIIIGASGSGKSSLLKAERAAAADAAARPMGDAAGHPSREGADGGARQGDGAARSASRRTGATGTQTLERTRTPSTTIERAACRTARIGEARGATVLLPIDQFEEMFTIDAADRARGLPRICWQAVDSRATSRSW